MLADVLLEKHEQVRNAVGRLLAIASDTSLTPTANVSATRALTALLDQAFGRMPQADQPAEADDEATPWELMTPTQRAKARAALDAWLQEHEAEHDPSATR